MRIDANGWIGVEKTHCKWRNLLQITATRRNRPQKKRSERWVRCKRLSSAPTIAGAEDTASVPRFGGFRVESCLVQAIKMSKNVVRCSGDAPGASAPILFRYTAF